MRHDETLLLRLASEIEAEIGALMKLRAEFEAAPRETGDSYSLRARASILHDFYTGVEHVFLRVAEELNGGVPRSEHWHRQLLVDMTLDLDSVRPAVISRELAELLGPYLRFRHLFRNLYGYILDRDRIAALEKDFSVVFDRFITESRTFAAWLRRTG